MGDWLERTDPAGISPVDVLLSSQRVHGCEILLADLTEEQAYPPGLPGLPPWIPAEEPKPEHCHVPQMGDGGYLAKKAEMI